MKEEIDLTEEIEKEPVSKPRRSRRRKRSRGNKSGNHSQRQSQQPTQPLRASNKNFGLGMKLGIPNQTRYWVGQAGSPFVIPRQGEAFAGFYNGFCQTADVATGDDGDAIKAVSTLALSVTGSLVPMLPITPVANNYVNDVEPRMLSLFSQVRYSSSSIDVSYQYNFRRYQAIQIFMYGVMLSVEAWKQIYDMDWRTIFPGSIDRPNFLETLADSFKLRPGDYESTWSHYKKRMESFIIPPQMVSEMKRFYAPFLLGAAGGRTALVTQDEFATPASYNSATIIAKFSTLLSDFETNATYRGFYDLQLRCMPFLLSNQDPWERLPIGMDPDFEGGWANSGLYSASGFSKTAAPTGYQETIESGGIYDWQTIYRDGAPDTEVTWGEFYKETSSFDGGDGFILQGFHTYGNIKMRDDGGTLVTLDGAEALSASERKYEVMANCRFTTDAVASGRALPDRLYCFIDQNSMTQMFKLRTQQVFNVEAITELMKEAQGAGVRTIRPIVDSTYRDNV
jgi:hypothetical protein